MIDKKHNARQVICLICIALIFILLLGAFSPFRINGPVFDTRSTPSVHYFPLFFNSMSFTTSYYMKTVDENDLYEMGCELGSRDAGFNGTQDNIVVLDFSYPICNGTTYGAELFGYGHVTTDQIAAAVEQFGSGYYECTGQDNDSTLLIGIGTNNKVPKDTDYTCDTEGKAFDHGAAWAAMTNSVNQWFIDNGLFSQVSAAGASDMELGFNGPAWTRQWVDGYSSGPDPIPMLIHFGDAAGCPYDGNTWTCGTPDYPEWSVDDVWYVSYGAPPSFPIPLIYLTSGVHAKQWAQMSSYSYAQYGEPIIFLGAFTQYQACQQRGCDRTDNTPAQAYQQMMLELGKDPNIAQELRFLTDIKWMWEPIE